MNGLIKYETENVHQLYDVGSSVTLTSLQRLVRTCVVWILLLAAGIVCLVLRAGGGGVRVVGGVTAAHRLCDVRPGCGGCGGHLVRTVCSSTVLSQHGAGNLLIKSFPLPGWAGGEGVLLENIISFFLETPRASERATKMKTIFIKRLRGTKYFQRINWKVKAVVLLPLRL